MEDGSVEGMADEVTVGSDDGMELGDPLGTIDGDTEGVLLRDILGAADGNPDGPVDGINDGSRLVVRRTVCH